MTEPGSTPATVAELWRYPVKSMRGERVDASDVGDAGVDRRPHVRGGRRRDRQGRQREASPVVGCAAAVQSADVAGTDVE